MGVVMRRFVGESEMAYFSSFSDTYINDELN
jgi:hypothetical protein